ncbi:hypothetical protein [Polymorphobacter megasporae]|uniref:hypothetical protein n=1 Tax=Glacieibacterium megasporae TaxID=2835787 RepID=UPI001C1E0C9A|nr:hypothetical protein [Polymorphobacter megasporae]UAJ11128.1 hypothetical protein KTC28_05310 [Polymorphobacter megasporae]
MPIALLALILAAPIAAASPLSPPEQAITITGTRLKDYAAAVDACIAASCSPKRDIVVSIRYAEAQFRSGDYVGARAVLAKAVRRQAGAGNVEPVALSQLYLAQANVAAHYGEQRDVRAATYASARVTHEFLPAGSPDRLWADLRVADLRLANDRRDGFSAYRKVAAEARAAGQPSIAVSADLHWAWALHKTKLDSEALRLLAELAATPGDDARPYRLVARVLTARIARDRGDKAAIDAVLRDIAAEPDPGQPLLVYSPPFPQPTDPFYRDPFEIPVDRVGKSSDFIGLQWVDIGFGIAADGSVDKPEVLRSSRSSTWAAPLVKMIGGRRYTPSAATLGDDAPGHYRIERYTLTADFSVPVGSLVRRRSREPHYEQLDLTDGNVAAPEHAPS